VFETHGLEQGKRCPEAWSGAIHSFYSDGQSTRETK
jgi:hypothetical protein